MSDTLAHRGPDGTESWIGGAVGAGHRMLHTTPESLREKLPLIRGDLVLTADVRLDNREELIRDLDLTGRSKEEIGDGEIVLAAYERWGEDSPRRLLGDFAFVIWDRKKQELFCARDFIGARPFYYYSSGRVFVFASEIKALLCAPEVPRRLNELRVAEYLVPTEQDNTITFFRDILRLPPAHSLTVGPGRSSMRRYWSPDPSREIRLGSDGEYVEAFREIFAEAVRCRLRSAYPVGSELSGGLDSSSVTCMARTLHSGRLHTFSAIYDDVPKGDERAFMGEVLKGGGLEPHFLQADRARPLGDLERLTWHLDAPFLSGVFASWELRKLLPRLGVRVLLTGVDGDTVVTHGDSSLLDFARGGRWVTLATEINALSKVLGRSRRRLLLQAVIKPLTPEPALRSWRRLRGRPRPRLLPWVDESLLRSDFSLRVGLEDHFKTLERDPPRSTRVSRASHWRGLTSATWPYILELDDGIGGAFSFEHRYPFFDRRLVEFCLALPPEQKLNHGWSRAILRRAMAGYLPDKVRWRNNKGMSQGHAWARSLMFDQELLEDLISEDPRAIEEYVDMDALRSTYRRFASERDPSDFHLIVMAAYLSFWLRRTRITA